MAPHVGFHISRKRIQGHFRDQVQDLEGLGPGTGRKSWCAPFGSTPAAQKRKICIKSYRNHPGGALSGSWAQVPGAVNLAWTPTSIGNTIRVALPLALCGEGSFWKIQSSKIQQIPGKSTCGFWTKRWVFGTSRLITRLMSDQIVSY